MPKRIQNKQFIQAMQREEERGGEVEGRKETDKQASRERERET